MSYHPKFCINGRMREVRSISVYSSMGVSVVNFMDGTYMPFHEFYTRFGSGSDYLNEYLSSFEVS